VQNSPFPITGHITFPTVYLIFGALWYKDEPAFFGALWYKDEPACLLIFRKVTFSIIFRITILQYLTCPSIIFSLSFFRVFQKVKQLVCVSYKISYYTPTGAVKAYEIFWMTRNFPEHISLIHSSCICVSHSQQACCKLATSGGMKPVLLHVLL
jgi:hypothetical protein